MLFRASYQRSTFQIRVIKVFCKQSGFTISLRCSEIGSVGQIAVREHAAVVIHLKQIARMIDWIVCQALEITDGREWLHFGAAAANGYRREGIWANNQDGFDLALTQRQQVTVVLQQRDAFTRGVERHLAALRVIAGNGQTSLITIEPA